MKEGTDENLVFLHVFSASQNFSIKHRTSKYTAVRHADGSWSCKHESYLIGFNDYEKIFNGRKNFGTLNDLMLWLDTQINQPAVEAEQ